MNTETLSPEQRYAYQQFCKGENIFITGPGGTGKTKLISNLVEYCRSNIIPHQVCALTGCAALLLNCGARTLHSWSGIKLAKGPNHYIIANIRKNRRICAEWRKIKVLIVDEVSMMSMKIFELIEEVARATRLSQLPFGGIQVVFCGDFYQLPPVGTAGQPETELFCFESPVWTQVFPRKNHVQLQTIFRQVDPLYKSILLQIREGTLSEENAKILQGYVKREFNPEEHNGCLPTKLFPTRAKTDFLNKLMFSKLADPEYTFTSEKRYDCKTYLDSNKAISTEDLIKGSKLSAQEIEYELEGLMNSSNLQDTLVLKKGAVVMCTMNLDMDSGICNGSQGIVIDVLEQGGKTTFPVVKFSNGLIKTIQPQFRQSDEYPTIAIGQIPLMLAWALTIHKIQGATLEMADIDVGTNIFEYGQTYVALSRVQSLNGLYLTAFNTGRIRANESVRAFYGQLPKDVNYEDIMKEKIIPASDIKKIRL
jgi:ATP-dependent DNA helicase PIF1